MTGYPHCARNDPDLFDEDGWRKPRYDFDDDGKLYKPVKNEKGRIVSDDDD
eukprot:CAMPEP_0116859576 /NCGR_PEP_ID=MMETSP0418-20121206/21898_1 /TAXON_ID=1158023 /ORGANISM="Astrosyne radiata, Strain 13vi08-1A" /LENGTH=50 /DNA_ID=CAMNT_0004493811 /DNA_START=1 /DNA_END=150 /DNA_ORIENTATION=-